MSARAADQNYYDILEVSSQAPHHEIVKAYHRAKATYSLDSPALYSMFTREEADELRLLIEEAYQVLGNEAKRRQYDEKINSTEAEPELPDFPPPQEVEVMQLRRPEDSTVSVKRTDFDKNAPIPEGFKRSRLSVYEVKPEVESEITSCADFDGAMLRKVRLYKNINLDQLAKETRISRTYIAAVESNDYEALPAPVFVRGFIIQIARILGLEEEKVSSSYMNRVTKTE
jgi:curved DNA-binding protein CbpA